MSVASRLLLCAPKPGGAAEPQATTPASQAELDALLAAAASGKLCRVRSAIQPHFSQAALMAALARALLCGHPGAASLLLCHTRKLPLPQAGQNGSLPDLDGVLAATVRRFAADGGLEAAGGWAEWGGDHLYLALELGLQRTAAALFDCGAQLPAPEDLLGACSPDGSPGGRTCLHTLAESTHAWRRPDLAVLARRLVALGAPLTALDSQGRTPLLAALQHRLRRNCRVLHSRDGLDLLLALCSPRSAAVGAPMQLAASQGDCRAVACMARGGGADAAAVQAALPLAAAHRFACDVAALRLCGARVQAAQAAGLVDHHERLHGALTLDTAGLLMRFGGLPGFHKEALLRVLGSTPVTAAALAAAAAAAATPQALAATGQAAGREAADDARLAARRTAAVVAQQARPFLLCMHRLAGEAGGTPGRSCCCRKRRSALPLPVLPGSAVELICVLLLLHGHFLD